MSAPQLSLRGFACAARCGEYDCLTVYDNVRPVQYKCVKFQQHVTKRQVTQHRVGREVGSVSVEHLHFAVVCVKLGARKRALRRICLELRSFHEEIGAVGGVGHGVRKLQGYRVIGRAVVTKLAQLGIVGKRFFALDAEVNTRKIVGFNVHMSQT